MLPQGSGRVEFTSANLQPLLLKNDVFHGTTRGIADTSIRRASAHLVAGIFANFAPCEGLRQGQASFAASTGVPFAGARPRDRSNIVSRISGISNTARLWSAAAFAR